MNHRTRSIAIAVALPWLVGARVARAQIADADGPALREHVDSVFDSWRGTERPGCVVAMSRHGRTVLRAAYGMADIESGAPMTPSTVVHAASLAKSVTAMAILLLVREGRLSLDDDVRRYLPELPDYGTPIAVRQLLGHTSGLRDFFELLILARGRFEESRITDADALAMVDRQRGLNFAPGADFGYSNTNYLLAAHLVERVSGQSFNAFVSQRIFVPLGMTHSRFRDDVSALVPGRAVGYARRGAGWRTSIPNYDVVGPTNLLTTVDDLLLWVRNFDHPAVGDSALVRQMLAPGVLAGGDTTAYGFGLSLGRDRGARVVEHEGRDPGFRAYLGWYPDAGLAVALLCNSTALDPVAMGHRVAGLALTLPPQPPRAAAPSRAVVRFAIGRSELGAYVGRYSSRELDATYRVDAGDSTLVLRVGSGAQPWLVGRPVAPDTFASGQYTIEFVRDGQSVTGFRISHPRARRVTFTRDERE